MAKDFNRIQPAEYLRRYVSQGVRPDGRRLMETRSVSVNVGSVTTADGSALVKIGNTTVLCGIKAEFTLPGGENNDEGYVIPNFELSSVASPQSRSGPPSEEAQVISKFLSDLITRSSILNLHDLCIEVGKLAWVLYCDFACLDQDGSLTDASVVALVASIANLRLPHAIVNEYTGLGEVTGNKDVQLQLNSFPVTTTFGLFEG
ncbi:exosome complex component RRP43-like [Corticium candelabrum]|uniref:exosome complex component RRP43-like n=1 Tax=Corticium candelabrum TaxID=121492 RepID=UPI002E275BAA|nr:exosome complex component RRP43-like [Corticium candelabrum]